MKVEKQLQRRNENAMQNCGDFIRYFKQLNRYVVEEDYNQEFLIRCLGLTKYLIPYLERIRNPSELTKRLLRRLNHQTEETYHTLGIHRNGDRAVTERYYRRCVKKLSQ